MNFDHTRQDPGQHPVPAAQPDSPANFGRLADFSKHAKPANPASRRDRSLATARALAVPVFILAAAAAALGLFSRAPGGPGSLTNAWGTTVVLDGHGLYARESVSGAAQERAQDIVTLVVGLPLLAAAFLHAGHRRQNGTAPVLLAGSLGYFLYAYGLMAVGAVFNPFFLGYVAIFALALFAFIFAMLAVDVDALAAACAARYPRRLVVVLDLATAGLLGLMWLARVVPVTFSGAQPAGLDGYHTLFVQALDLGIIVPVAILSAVWLLRHDPRGYLIATVLLVKGAAMGLAVGTMGVSMNLAGAGAEAPLPFVVSLFMIAAACTVTAYFALRSAAGKS